MKSPTARRALRLAVAFAATSSLGTGIASASTWTVDDDRAQCPSAGFTTIQAAVDQAAPHDTIVVCDGTYAEQSTPLYGNAQSPAQAGSRNGLTITKPLTIKGAGASRVTIMPASALGATLAGSAPYLGDGGGNVITISRQSLGSTDANENFVDISGVTVTSPSAYVEAGIAFFNTSGRVANSTVGPLLRAPDSTAFAAAPHGWGIIMTNSLQGAEAGVRRELTVANSLVTGYQAGGILFDDGRGADGDAANTTRSGVTEYGTVTGTRVVGVGATSVFPQTGVKYADGARGAVTGSEIAGNRYSTDLRQSVGLLLTDVASGTDPQNPGQPAFSASGVSFTGNGYAAFNADAANSAVRLAAPATVDASYFGCALGPIVGGPSSFAGANTGCQGVSGDDAGGTPAPSLALGTPLTAAPNPLTVPAATPDALPTGALLTGDLTVAPGQTISPVVAATDDFGVKKVTLLLDGVPIASDTTVPYELSPTWTPSAKDTGKSYSLVAQVVDSAGQIARSAPTTVTVAGSRYTRLIADVGSRGFGDVTVGQGAAGTVTLTNHDDTTVRVGAVAVSGAGFAVTGGSCAAGTVLAPGATCTVVVGFAPGAAGAASGTLTVTPTGGDDPVAVALAGTGVAVPVTVPPPATPAPPTVPVPPAAPPAPPAPAPATSTRHTVGVLTASVPKAPELSGRSIRIGTFTCATKCTVKVTGTLTAGGKKTKVSLTRTLSAKKATTLALKVSSSVAARLEKAGQGTLSLRIAVGGRSKAITLKVTA
jgi:Bacterial Ig domain